MEWCHINSKARSFLFRATILVVVALLVLPLVVSADNVVIDVAANSGSGTFSATGSTPVGYKIVATGGDGQTGCNVADATPATMTINVPSGVTLSPTSHSFTLCTVLQSVVFSSSTPGDYTITVSVIHSGAGSYNTVPAAFTLHMLASPNTAPTGPGAPSLSSGSNPNSIGVFGL